MIARVLVVALLAACGSRSVGPKGPTDTRTDEEVLAELKPGEPTVLELGTSGAKYYNAAEPAPAPESERSRALFALMNELAQRAGVTMPEIDPRLSAAAGDIALMPSEPRPPNEAVVFALRHHGIIEPAPTFEVHRWRSGRPEDVPEQVAESLLKSLLEKDSTSRVGIGVATDGEEDSVAMLFLSSYVDTDPIPRSMRADQSIEIRATVASGYGSPEVFLTNERGEVSTPKMRVEGRKLAIDFSCSGHRGRQQVEILASGQRGPTTLANFPVWCAETPPTSFQAEDSEEFPVTDAADAERQMLAAVNKDRKAAGLPALESHAKLADVARAHSDEMQRTDIVAHRSPTTGGVGDRVKAGGIRSAEVMENLARATGVMAAQRGLMDSPGHRGAILSSTMTHAGIGIVLREEDDSTTFFVTQVFIRVSPKIDTAEARKKMVADIKAAGSLETASDLAAVAQGFADDVAAGRSNTEASKRSAKGLDKLSSRYGRALTILKAVSDLSSFPINEVNKDKAMTHYGVGLAQGDDDVIGEGAIYIVVIVGEQR